MVNGRSDQIQFWRFLSFFLIFSYHARQWTWWTNSDNFLTGIQGLCFFIFLSGAMTSFSLHQKEFRDDPKAILDHRIKTIIRAYPLYIATNCLTLVYYIPFDLVLTHNFKGLASNFMEFVLSAFLLQTWVLKTEIYNAPCWYLASIFWCGVLSIPIYLLSEKILTKKRPILLLSLLGLVGTLYTLVSAVVIGTIFNLDLTTVPIVYHPLVLVGVFVTATSIGYIITLLKDRTAEMQNRDSIFTILEIITSVIWLLMALHRGPANSLLLYIPAILINIPLIIVYILGYGKLTTILKFRPLVYLGNITFETYLLHQVIIFVFCYIHGWGSYGRTGDLYAFCLCMFITLLSSAFLHSMVGRRTMR